MKKLIKVIQQGDIDKFIQLIIEKPDFIKEFDYQRFIEEAFTFNVSEEQQNSAKFENKFLLALEIIDTQLQIDAGRAVEQDTHWYTDDEINCLLQHYLEKQPDVELLTAMLGNNWQGDNNTLRDNLSDFHERRRAKTSNQQAISSKIVVPINLGNRHWVLLLFEYANDNTNTVIRFCYFDPLGFEIIQGLRDAVLNSLNLSNAFEIDNPKIKLQYDSYNCGPWIVHATQALLNKEKLKGVDIKNIREEQQSIYARYKQPSDVTVSVRKSQPQQHIQLHEPIVEQADSSTKIDKILHRLKIFMLPSMTAASSILNGFSIYTTSTLFSADIAFLVNISFAAFILLSANILDAAHVREKIKDLNGYLKLSGQKSAVPPLLKEFAFLFLGIAAIMVFSFVYAFQAPNAAAAALLAGATAVPLFLRMIFVTKPISKQIAMLEEQQKNNFLKVTIAEDQTTKVNQQTLGMKNALLKAIAKGHELEKLKAEIVEQKLKLDQTQLDQADIVKQLRNEKKIELEVMEKKLDAAQKKNEDFQIQIEKLQARQAELQEVQQKLIAAKTENKELQAQIEQLQQAKQVELEVMNTQLASLQTENTRLKTENDKIIKVDVMAKFAIFKQKVTTEQKQDNNQSAQPLQPEKKGDGNDLVSSSAKELLPGK